MLRQIIREIINEEDRFVKAVMVFCVFLCIILSVLSVVMLGYFVWHIYNYDTILDNRNNNIVMDVCEYHLLSSDECDVFVDYVEENKHKIDKCIDAGDRGDKDNHLYFFICTLDVYRDYINSEIIDE